MFEEDVKTEGVNETSAEPVYEDITLTCRDCGEEFVFTAGEQKFYAEKGFMNKPKCCKACRDKKKIPEKPKESILSRFAVNAAVKQDLRFSLQTTDLFIAASVLRHVKLRLIKSII